MTDVDVWLRCAISSSGLSVILQKRVRYSAIPRKGEIVHWQIGDDRKKINSARVASVEWFEHGMNVVWIEPDIATDESFSDTVLAYKNAGWKELGSKL